MSSVRWPTGGANWQSQQIAFSETKDMKKSGAKSHSWWWDSHNAPKNSKWLEENLSDMDSKVKAMLKLIEEDADSFAKRAEMYYKKRPELVSLVEEFYRAYRSLAERYDQLTGHIRQIPQEIQAQFGFSGDISPGSPGSGSVRRRAKGFSVFGNSGTHKHSKEKDRRNGSDSSSSSSSDSDSDSKHGKSKHSDEMQRLLQDNDQLRLDLDRGIAHHQALESRLAEIQEEMKSLHQENVQLHRNAASAHSEIAALEAEIERLKRENLALGEEASSALRSVERLRQELDVSQGEKHRISIRLEETGFVIRDLEVKIKELELKILHLSEELSSSTALCKRQQQEVTSLNEERSTLQKEVAIQASRIVELAEEIVRLKGSLSLAESERDRNFELHRTLEQTLTDLHLDFSSVKEERGKLSEELAVRVQHVQSLEQQLSEVQEALEGLGREKADVHGLLSKAGSSLVGLQNELDSIQGRMNEEISAQVEQKLVFQKQVEELQAALEALHEERTREVDLREMFGKRVADLELQLERAQEALEFTEKEKTELVNKAEVSLSELQVDFGSMQDRLNRELGVQAQEKQVLVDQVSELKIALEVLHGERSQGIQFQNNLEERLSDLELQLKQSREALESTEREKTEVTGLLRIVETDLLGLQSKFTSVQESLNEEMLVQVHEKETLQLRVEELEAALAALHSEKSRSLELQDVLEKRLMDYEQQLENVKSALELAKREKAEVGELLSNVEASLLELKEESSSMQARLTAEVSALSGEKQSLTLQMEELQATLAELHGEKSRGVELQDVLEKRMIELQEELSQAKQEAGHLSDDLAGRAAIVSQLEEEVNRRDGIVSTLQVDLLAKQEEGEVLRDQLEDCSRHLQILENEVQKLRVLLEGSEDATKSLEMTVKDFEQDLESGRVEANRLKIDLEEKVTLIRRLESELQGKEMLATNLHNELLVNQEEGQILRKQVDALIKEKGTLMDEDSVNLEEIDKLKRELQHTSETLSEKASFIANLEMQCKMLVEESEKKQAHHAQQYQAVTSDRERVEVELDMFREAKSKLEEELAGILERAQQLELDLKMTEENATTRKEELAKLKVDLDFESNRARGAEEKCLLQERLTFDLQEEKARRLVRVEELETLLKSLQEENDGYVVKIENAHQAKEASDVEILALKDELLKVNLASEGNSLKLSETISFLNAEISKLEALLVNRTEELQSLEKEQAGWYTERAAFTEKISEATKEKEALQNTILMWTERLDRLEMEHTSLKSTSRDVESSLLFHQTEYSRVQSELSEKLERIQSLEEELKKLQLELEGSQEQGKQLSLELQRVTRELKGQLLAEEEKVQLLNGDVNRLQQDLLNAQEARESVMSTCQEHVKLFEIKKENLESQILKFKGQVQDMDDLCKELAKKLEENTNTYEAEKQGLQETLHATQMERDTAIKKCDSFQYELAQEHECLVTTKAAASEYQVEIAELRAEIARLQTELQELKDGNRMLTVKLDAALEQERIYASEIDTLLKALQGFHEDDGNPDVVDRSWHFEMKHSGEEKSSTLRHLKDKMLHLLTDRSRINQEAAAHAQHIETLHLEIEKSGQILEASRGDYNSLLSKYEATQTELQVLQSRITQFEEQVLLLEEEKSKLHDQLLASVKDSEQFSSEKKELSEKLVVESEHMFKLQEELRLVSEKAVEDGKNIDDLQNQIKKLLLDIERITTAKDDQEKTLKEEVQKLEESSALWQEERLSLTSSLNLNEQKARDLKVQIGMLTQEKEDMSFELQVKVALLSDQEQEIQKLQRQLEESEIRLQGLKEHSTLISQKFDTTLAELESLRLQLSSIQEENGKLEVDVLAKTVSVTELTETVSSVEKKNVDLYVELKKVQEHDLLLQKEVANLQFENEQLKQTLKSGLEDIQMLEDEISNLRELHAKLQSDHESVTIDRQRSLDEHSVTMVTLEKLRKDLLFQQSEKERMETELVSQSARIEELEITISNLEKERQAFSVEIASTALLINDVQRRADGLQEEVNRLEQELMSSNEQLKEKTEKIQELSSMCSTLGEEKAALSIELQKKIQSFGSLDASFCALKDEHLSLVDKYEILTEEAASGANSILKLQEEISLLRSERVVQDQEIIRRNADIQRLKDDLSLVQESEKRLSTLLNVKVQEVVQLEEELDKIKAAWLVFQEEHKENTEKLEVELKRLELVVIDLRDEKIALSEQHALILGKCNDLEIKCKSLQRQLAEQHAERNRLEGQLSVIEKRKKESIDDVEMVRVMKERVASKQLEIDQVQSINEDLKEIMRKFENEVDNLKDQIITLQKKNTLLIEDASVKASLAQELDQRLTSFKETKVLFEGDLAVAVGNVGLIQAEVDKLLEKISKLNELSVTTAENLQQMEDRICKLQVSNLSLRDELSGSAQKEKSYVIAVRFMRAEFFCLVQRVKAMKEERVSLEVAMEGERKKNSEVLSGLQQELAFLREENKRQRSIIFDRAEEKREAIRQLCATLDYMQDKNRRLEATINSVRDKIQRRIAASGTRRS